MRARLFLAVLVGSLSVGYAGAAETVLTFEWSQNSTYTSPTTMDGYEFGNPAGEQQHFHVIDSTLFSSPSNGTGVLLNDTDARIYIKAADDAGFTQFRMLSFDAAADTGSLPAEELFVSGYLNGQFVGGFNISPLGGYDSYSGDELGVVDIVYFDGASHNGGAFILDNVALVSVPEPASWILLGCGAIAFVRAAACRRSHK